MIIIGGSPFNCVEIITPLDVKKGIVEKVWTIKWSRVHGKPQMVLKGWRQKNRQDD